MEPNNDLNKETRPAGYKKNVDVVTRRIGGELFLVPIKGNIADMQRIFTLNPVAEYIWQKLEEESLSEISSGILKEFDVDKERVDADVKEFISELSKAGLITE